MHERDEKPDNTKERGDRKKENHVELPVVDAVTKLNEKYAREAVYRPQVA